MTSAHVEYFLAKGKSMSKMKLNKFIIPVFQLTLFISISINAFAADMRTIIHGSGSYRQLVIEGPIESGDFDKFIKIIRDNQGQLSTVYIFSSGGDFYEAMKIGRAMRALELVSMVPMRNESGLPSCEGLHSEPKPNDPKNCTCASACFFIHIGGIHRGGTYLAVHRPYFEKGKFGKLTETEAKKAFDALQDSAREYMIAMGVPKHIQEDVLGTPSERALILDEKTVKTYFWLELPYRHEWIMNKCSQLSNEETARHKSYSQRLKGTPSASSGDLSKEEWADLVDLQKKQAEESKCYVLIDKKNRIDAYEKYFHAKPNDYANHNFSKWSSASNYLGKNFDELLNEERFEESKTSFGSRGEMYSLQRSITSSAPKVYLKDSLRKPRVVNLVSLTSTPDISQEFTRRLVKSLEDSWGTCSSGDGFSQWQWNEDKFTAKLIRESSAEGPYLNLSIDEVISPR